MAAAYDGAGYRSQPPYADSTYDPNYDRQHQTSYCHSSSAYDAHRPRSRASSNAPPPTALDGFQQPAVQQPLNNALNNAFDKSDSARAVDPELIAQITAEVKKSVLDEIKFNGVNGVGGTTGHHPQPGPPPPQPYVPQSPASTSASFPTRNVYTPPSPKYADFSSHGSASPDPTDPLARDPTFDAAGDTPTPRHERTAPVNIPYESTSRSRPVPPQRMPTEGDFSPIEKMWQRLFDLQDQPTPRLGQFLRGLAIHLV
jgi:hypothetical protein